MNVEAMAWGNNVPIQLTITAQAVATATAEAQSMLGSGRCGATGASGAGYAMRR